MKKRIRFGDLKAGDMFWMPVKKGFDDIYSACAHDGRQAFGSHGVFLSDDLEIEVDDEPEKAPPDDDEHREFLKAYVLARAGVGKYACEDSAWTLAQHAEHEWMKIKEICKQ